MVTIKEFTWKKVILAWCLAGVMCSWATMPSAQGIAGTPFSCGPDDGTLRTLNWLSGDGETGTKILGGVTATYTATDLVGNGLMIARASSGTQGGETPHYLIYADTLSSGSYFTDQDIDRDLVRFVLEFDQPVTLASSALDVDQSTWTDEVIIQASLNGTNVPVLALPNGSDVAWVPSLPPIFRGTGSVSETETSANV